MTTEGSLRAFDGYRVSTTAFMTTGPLWQPLMTTGSLGQPLMTTGSLWQLLMVTGVSITAFDYYRGLYDSLHWLQWDLWQISDSYSRLYGSDLQLQSACVSFWWLQWVPNLLLVLKVGLALGQLSVEEVSSTAAFENDSGIYKSIWGTQSALWQFWGPMWW